MDVTEGDRVVGHDWRGRPFADFYASVYSRVAATVCLYVADSEAALDATDEAFVRAAGAWRRVQRMESPVGWVVRVAINRAKKQAARDGRQSAAERQHVRQHENEATELDPMWQFDALVSGLPKRQRQAVVLRYVADLTQEQIADLMGIRRGTVSSLLASANDRVRRDLGTGDLDAEHPKEFTHE